MNPTLPVTRQVRYTKSDHLTLKNKQLITNMSTILDSVNEEYLLCFDPDLESFRTLCSLWLDNWVLHLPLAWPSIPRHADFVDYCCFALRIYSHLLSSQVFTRFHFVTDSSAKLNTYSIHVPVYILDMIREICRPMYTNTYTELRTYFPLTNKGLGLVPGLGMKSSYGPISAWVERSEIVSKPIVEEKVGTTPVCIVSSNKLYYGYSNGSVLPDFRQEAITMLKFISIHPRFILGSSKRENALGTAVGYRVPLYGESWDSESIVENTTTKNLVAKGYSRDDGCFIYDTSLTKCSYYDVLGSRIDTCYLTSNDDGLPNTGDDHTNSENAIGLTNEALGAIPYDYLALIMKAYSISDSEFEDPRGFRARFNFGTTFLQKIIPIIPHIENRFPSNAHPSKESLSNQATTKVSGNKTPRKPARDRKQPAISPPNPDEQSDEKAR